MKKEKKDVIRVGDRVKIINPEFFVRCGYRIDTTKACEILLEKHGKAIYEFFATELDFLGGYGVWDNNGYSSSSRVINEIARHYNKKVLHYGGKERVIETQNEPEYVGLEGIVDSIKSCNTGVYEQGHNHTDWESGYSEYEPPYLSQLKVHRILTVSFYTSEGKGPNYLCYPYYTANIENIHVQKVTTKEEIEHDQLT